MDPGAVSSTPIPTGCFCRLVSVLSSNPLNASASLLPSASIAAISSLICFDVRIFSSSLGLLSAPENELCSERVLRAWNEDGGGALRRLPEEFPAKERPRLRDGEESEEEPSMVIAPVRDDIDSASVPNDSELVFRVIMRDMREKRLGVVEL